MGEAVETINPDGTYTTDQYDPDGNLVYSTDAMGRVTQNVYYTRDRQIATINPDGSVLLTEYDGGGRIVGQTDALGNTTQYVYDKLGRQTEEIQSDPAGSTDAATGDDYGTEPSGTAAYMAAPSLVSLVNSSFEKPQITTSPYYMADPSGQGVGWTFTGTAGIAEDQDDDKMLDYNPDAPDGYQVAYLQYTGQSTGSFSQIVSLAAGTYTIGFQAAYSATGDGGDTCDGCADPFQVQIDGQSVGTFTPATYATYQGYLVSFTITSGGNHTVSFVGLDASGNQPTSLIDAVWISAGSPVPSTVTTLTTYNDAANTQTVQDALGNTTETIFDALGRKIEEIDADPATGTASQSDTSCPKTYYAYDADGNLTSVTDPRGFQTVYQYDESNRQTVERTSIRTGRAAVSTPGTITTPTAIYSTSSMPTAPRGRVRRWPHPFLPRSFRTTPPSTSTTIWIARRRRSTRPPAAARPARPRSILMTPTETWLPRPTPTAT